MFRNGFIKSKEFHIISTRKAFDTQHIALAWSESPMCGAKISEANEVPLLSGYLCQRCEKKLARLTKRAVELGDSAPSQALSTPEVDPVVEADSTTPKIGGIYEFTNYDGKPATLKVVDVTETHVWYKWTDEIALHTYPMALELWYAEDYKLIS